MHAVQAKYPPFGGRKATMHVQHGTRRLGRGIMARARAGMGTFASSIKRCWGFIVTRSLPLQQVPTPVAKNTTHGQSCTGEGNVRHTVCETVRNTELRETPSPNVSAYCTGPRTGGMVHTRHRMPDAEHGTVVRRPRRSLCWGLNQTPSKKSAQIARTHSSM